VIAAVLGVILISALDVLTEDTSAAAQAFFAFPIFWAASHLRAPGVVLVTAAVLAGNCLTLFLLLPPAAALTDTIFFGAELVVMAVLLVRQGEAGTGHRAQGAGHRRLADGPATRRAFDGALEKALSRSVPGGTALVLLDVESSSRTTAVSATRGRRRPGQSRDRAAHAGPGRGRRPLAAGRGRVDHPDARVPQGRGGAPGREPAPGGPLVAMTLADGTLLALSISVGVATSPSTPVAGAASTPPPTNALYDAECAGRGRVSVATA
jgi:hypothetical protein